MSTFAGLWVLLRWHGVFTLITCAGTRVVLAVQNFFALFTFDDFSILETIAVCAFPPSHPFYQDASQFGLWTGGMPPLDQSNPCKSIGLLLGGIPLQTDLRQLNVKVPFICSCKRERSMRRAGVFKTLPTSLWAKMEQKWDDPTTHHHHTYNCYSHTACSNQQLLCVHSHPPILFIKMPVSSDFEQGVCHPWINPIRVSPLVCCLGGYRSKLTCDS